MIEIQFRKEVEDFFRSAQQLTDPTDKEAVLSYLRDNGIGGRYCIANFLTNSYKAKIANWIVNKMLPKMNPGLSSSFLSQKAPVEVAQEKVSLKYFLFQTAFRFLIYNLLFAGYF